MTTTEARAALIAHDPEVSCCVETLEWYHAPNKIQRTVYAISIFTPNCNRIEDESLDKLLIEAKEMITFSKIPIPPLFSHATH